jgi:hydrogenase-4 component F
MGLVPLNNWLPDAYSESPAPVTALLSGLLSTAALYTLIRFKIIVDQALNSHLAGYLMMGFGLLSFLVAAILIHRQKNIKRMFSYSSIEHIGLITFGFGLGGPLATFSAVFYMLMHALVKSAIFINIGNITPSDQADQTQIGLICSQPFIGWCLLLATLAICGFPPFGIFTSELLLFMATVKSFPWLAMLLILGLITAFSGLLRNVHFIIYGDGNNYLSSSPPSLSFPRRRESNTLPIIIHLSLVIILGIYLPPILTQLLKQAAIIITGVV